MEKDEIEKDEKVRLADALRLIRGKMSGFAQGADGPYIQIWPYKIEVIMPDGTSGTETSDTIEAAEDILRAFRPF